MKTETRTKTESVEYEVAYCDFCEQDYEVEDMYEVWIGVQETGVNGLPTTPLHSGAICEHCAEGSFDFSGSRKEFAAHFVKDWKATFGIMETITTAILLGGALGIPFYIIYLILVMVL